MPPIEMIASPVRDRISIPIPKKYRAYSFVVTLTPVAVASDNRHRDARRGKKVSAFELMHCPILDEGEELDVRASRRMMRSKTEKPVYTNVHTDCKWLVDPNTTSTAELLEICEGEAGL